MGHVQCTVNQGRRLSTVMDRIRKSEPESTAIILVHYKMKFEPIHLREVSTQFFGQRGFSLLARVILYRGTKVCRGVNGIVAEHTGPEFSTIVIHQILKSWTTEELRAGAIIVDVLVAGHEMFVDLSKRQLDFFRKCASVP